MGLKIWNGRWYGRQEDADGIRYDRVYIAAKTMAEAIRMCAKVGNPQIDYHEMKNFFSQGAWGNSMADVAVEKGVWLGVRNDKSKPVRVL